jgi:hypothetical protein
MRSFYLFPVAVKRVPIGRPNSRFRSKDVQKARFAECATMRIAALINRSHGGQLERLYNFVADDVR